MRLKERQLMQGNHFRPSLTFALSACCARCITHRTVFSIYIQMPPRLTCLSKVLHRCEFLQRKTHAHSAPAMVGTGYKFFCEKRLRVRKIKSLEVYNYACICLEADPADIC